MIKGCSHVGISVESLDRSIKFYQIGFGMRLVILEPFGGDLYDQILGLKGASGRVAVLARDNLELELFEFSSPICKPSGFTRPVSDPGISHFCIEVQDIEAACKRLKEAGASFHCSPLAFSETVKATYGRDPDGNVFELLENGNP